MKLPFLASFIVLCVIFNISMRRVSRKVEQNEENFWEKEAQANNVRKKSLDTLEYVKIPVDTLPFGFEADNEALTACEEEVLALKNEKIVNLTGISNTDLKLAYGTANITPLTQYDQNYTSLVISLQKWGQLLYDLGYYPEATKVLEFAVKTRTDISATYRTLVDLYKTKLGLSEEEINKKLDGIMPIAKELNALSRQQIVDLIENSKIV
ncbi:hypothetical protein [Butyrivibrio proteoclasticus]|uniref:hypothetical protein n=1 Tax=Butyrivibrio proteoclasticus TaxID=43305 RepID=UPI00047BD6EF|nr:hypothetical protein [Butyrivibrio proteoclasticus]